jgi:hypothetical protein
MEDVSLCKVEDHLRVFYVNRVCSECINRHNLLNLQGCGICSSTYNHGLIVLQTML